MHLATISAVAAQIAPNYPQPVTTLGQNLKRIRKARKERQQDVAARMGVDQPQLSNWEQGRFKNVRLETLMMLAKGYRCAIDELVKGFDEEYDSLVMGDLIRQGGDQPSALSKGEQADVPASPAPSRLQQQHDVLHAAWTDVAFELSTMLVHRGVDIAAVAHDATARARKSRVRKGPRKTG